VVEFGHDRCAPDVQRRARVRQVVILIGATNYLDRIDSALKRPGRMGRHVLVRPPESEKEVAALVKFYVGPDLDQPAIAYAAKLAGNATPAAVKARVKAARRLVPSSSLAGVARRGNVGVSYTRRSARRCGPI
jgi:SpoVK/Ycf46/Vps4 family AAA+-type ATPase